MSSLDEFAAAKLSSLDAKSLRRRLVVTERGKAGMALRGEGQGGTRELISFCCNDYLNLSQNSEVKAAATQAIKRYGVGAGASRLVTGNHPLLEELEGRLADLKGTEAAVVFGSGYLTNTGTIPVFAGSNDLILIDELAHACLHAGAQLSQAEVRVFGHNDIDSARSILADRRAHVQHALIVTDGVFSMDGDLAPLPDLVKLAQAFDAWLMTDDAHGVGVLGEGRGSSFAWGEMVTSGDIPLQMGTLSKAIGSYGGYLCASQPVVDFVKTRARPFIYSTGLPPASAAAAIKAIEIIRRDPNTCAVPLKKARRFAHRLGLPEPQSTIVPIILGEEERTLAASRLLEDQGFLVTAIRPPTVPPGTSRLRFTFTAEHEDRDIDRLAQIVGSEILVQAAQ